MAKKKLPSGIELRGAVYWSNIRHGGKRIRRALGQDLTNAQLLLAEIRLRLARGEFGMATDDGDYKDAKDAYLRRIRQTNRDSGHEESAIRSLEEFYSPSRLSEVTLERIYLWRDALLAKDLANRTINRKVGTIRAMLKQAVRDKRIHSDPLTGLKRLPEDKPRKVRRALSPEELSRLLAEFSPAWRPFFEFLARTGCRRNEAATLKWSMVDFQRRVAIIDAGNAKSKKTREVPLDDELSSMLQKAKKRSDFELVFATEGGQKRVHNGNSRFYAACRRAGIADGKPNGAVDIHSLRVTFATILLDGGANPKDVQEILGHRTLDMTMRIYARSKSSSRQTAAKLLGHSLATVVVKKPKKAAKTSKKPKGRRIS